MADVMASIGPVFLNAVLGKVKMSGEKTFSGDIPIDNWPDPHYSITVGFSVTGIRVRIDGDQLKVSASVTVRAPKDGSGITYTSPPGAQAQVQPRIDNGQLVFRVTSLVVPIWIQPLGIKIDLGKVDVCPLLPKPIETPAKILPETYTEALPASLGGASLTVRVEKPGVIVRSGAVQASASLRVM